MPDRSRRTVSSLAKIQMVVRTPRRTAGEMSTSPPSKSVAWYSFPATRVKTNCEPDAVCETDVPVSGRPDLESRTRKGSMHRQRCWQRWHSNLRSCPLQQKYGAASFGLDSPRECDRSLRRRGRLRHFGQLLPLRQTHIAEWPGLGLPDVDEQVLYQQGIGVSQLLAIDPDAI